MTKLVLGFKSRRKNDGGEVLYLGTDGNDAREALMNPGEGFVRTELSYPMAAKTRHFQTPEEIEAAEKAKAEAEAAAEKVAEERAKLKAEAEEVEAAEAEAEEAEAEAEPAKKQGKKK